MLVAFALTCLGLGSSTKAFSATDVIYSFAGDEDGEYADTDLALDKAANLYGTTVLEGDFGSGTVFQLSPSRNGFILCLGSAPLYAAGEKSDPLRWACNAFCVVSGEFSVLPWNCANVNIDNRRATR